MRVSQANSKLFFCSYSAYAQNQAPPQPQSTPAPPVQPNGANPPAAAAAAEHPPQANQPEANPPVNFNTGVRSRPDSSALRQG